MNKKIYRILHLGVKTKHSEEKNRITVISNYLSILYVLLGLIILLADSLEHPKNFPDLSVSSLGAASIILFGFLGLLFNKTGWFVLSRFVISLLPMVCLQLYPLFIHEAIDEFYYWYPFGAVAASIVPQIVFSFRNERIYYRTCLAFYLVYILFIDNILIYFATDQVTILASILEHRLFYKLAPLFGFGFTTFTIGYLNYTNSKYEGKLMEANESLNTTIKELKVTQQHLIQSEKMASLGTLTAGIAHEINNPLNFISGGLNLLRDTKEELDSLPLEELVERCNMTDDMISDGLQKATNIVSGLMTFSYKRNPVLVNTNIGEILDNSLLFLKSKISPDIKLIRDYRLKEEVPIYPEKIHQVFMNVIDNAIFELGKLNGENKVLEIVTERENNNAIIKIGNSGEPISETIIRQIFDPFFTTKDPGVGTGLGLSISYNLISDHKGKIYAKNKKGKVYIITELPLEILN